MLSVLTMLTAHHRNEFTDCQKAKVRIAVLLLMDVKTRWNSTLELLGRAYRLWEFTREWLQNLSYTDYQPLFTTHDVWTIVKYVMEVLRPFRYWTLWMSKRHIVTLHHLFTAYNDIFNYMDGVMGALAGKKIRLKEHLFFAVMLTRLKLSKYCAEVTATTGMLLICELILGPFRKLRSFRKWYKGMDNNPDDETSCTTQYQEAFLKYVENEHCAKHRRVLGNTHESSTSCTLIHSGTASRSCPSPFDPYDLSRYDEQYLILNNVAETTHRQSNGTAHRSTAAMLYLNSPPEAPKTCGHIDPNLNDYHSDPIEISSTFWLPDITGWWRQQEKMSSKYANLPNVACDIFPIIPDGVAVEASFSLGRDEIG